MKNYIKVATGRDNTTVLINGLLSAFGFIVYSFCLENPLCYLVFGRIVAYKKGEDDSYQDLLISYIIPNGPSSAIVNHQARAVHTMHI